MSADKYIPNAATPAEHLNNCEFQLLNVKGFLMMAEDRAEGLTAARAKAECLLESAQGLLAVLQAEEKKTPVVKYQPHQPNHDVLEERA